MRSGHQDPGIGREDNDLLARDEAIHESSDGVHGSIVIWLVEYASRNAGYSAHSGGLNSNRKEVYGSIGAEIKGGESWTLRPSQAFSDHRFQCFAVVHGENRPADFDPACIAEPSQSAGKRFGSCPDFCGQNALGAAE